MENIEVERVRAELDEECVMPVPAPVHGTRGNLEQEAQSAEERWRKTVEEFSSRFTENVRGILTSYWDLGIVVKQVCENPHYHGRHGLIELGAVLNLSVDTLEACLRFHERYAPEERDAVIEKQLSWTAISHFLHVADKDERAKLEDMYAHNRINAKQLESACRKLSQDPRKSGKKGKRGGPTAPAVFRKVGRLAAELRESLDEFRAQAEALSQREEGEPGCERPRSACTRLPRSCACFAKSWMSISNGYVQVASARREPAVERRERKGPPVASGGPALLAGSHLCNCPLSQIRSYMPA